MPNYEPPPVVRYERVYVGAKTFLACLCIMGACLAVAALLLWTN